MSDNLKAQIERLTAANARLTAGGGGGSGFLAGYYQKHIRTGSFKPIVHMMGLLAVTGYAVEYYAHTKLHGDGHGDDKH